MLDKIKNQESEWLPFLYLECFLSLSASFSSTPLWLILFADWAICYVWKILAIRAHTFTHFFQEKLIAHFYWLGNRPLIVVFRFDLKFFVVIYAFLLPFFANFQNHSQSKRWPRPFMITLAHGIEFIFTCECVEKKVLECVSQLQTTNLEYIHKTKWKFDREKKTNFMTFPVNVDQKTRPFPFTQIKIYQIKK